MTASLDQARAWIIGLLPRLRRFARTTTRNHDDADELVQVTVELALQRYPQWRPESRFEGWMFGVMCNAWIDEVRSRQLRHHVPAPEEASTHTEDEADVAALSVQTAMAALPEDQRMAIALVLIEELSYREAAAALDIPIGTLIGRLARGREVLQALL